MILSSLTKICQKRLLENEKLAKKVDFRKFLDPILGFSTKKGFTIRESPNFVIPFGTKNHKMWGPPVFSLLISTLDFEGGS